MGRDASDAVVKDWRGLRHIFGRHIELTPEGEIVPAALEAVAAFYKTSIDLFGAIPWAVVFIWKWVTKSF
jgi:hypothetical protein